MRALPLGVPKVMLSTIASGDIKPYVGTRDVVMFPSVVDVAGVNRISGRAYAHAVGAIVGMVETPIPKIEEKTLLAASMFGNTTPIVNRCRKIMEEHGYEVLIFHAVGNAETLEQLVAEDYIAGVLDITTTEWADEIAGGVLPGGRNRFDLVADKKYRRWSCPVAWIWSISGPGKPYRINMREDSLTNGPPMSR